MKNIKRTSLQLINIGLFTFIFLLSCTKKELPQTSEEEQPLKPGFVWQGTSIQLDRENLWSLTRFPNRAAVTNFKEKTQYFLYWEGNMTDGHKPEALLKIGRYGNPVQTIRLDQLTIENLEDNSCRIQFYRGNDKGSLIFNK